MLELEIIRYIMKKDARAYLIKIGRGGFSVTPVMQEYGVPRATFYRSLNSCIKMGFIEKKGHNRYGLTEAYRGDCNAVKSGTK